MSPAEKTVLTDFKRRVALQLPLCQVVLFGSRARGDADPESDMDVLVVLDCRVTAADRRYVSECAWAAGFEQGIVVVPVTVSRNDWERGTLSSSLLAIAVQREGIPA